MTDNLIEEKTIKNRILLREITIRKLTGKYMDLVSRFNSLTRSEMAQLCKEILNEIDMIEISMLKAENFDRLGKVDLDYIHSHSHKIENEVGDIRSEINNCNTRLVEARSEKEYKINCEEVAKLINTYDSKEILEDKIQNLEEINSKIVNSQNSIMDKLESKSKKLALLVKLVDDLKDDFSTDVDKMDDGEMITD